MYVVSFWRLGVDSNVESFKVPSSTHYLEAGHLSLRTDNYTLNFGYLLYAYVQNAPNNNMQ